MARRRGSGRCGRAVEAARRWRAESPFLTFRPPVRGTRQGERRAGPGCSAPVPVSRVASLRRGLLVLLLLAFAGGRSVAASGLPLSVPERVGMRGDVLARIDPLVEDALREGQMAGCVVCIGRHGRVVFRKAYGFRQVLPKKERMTVDTLFDLASLTKPVATATSVLLLVERGEVRLRDRVAQYIPEFAQNGKQSITVEQLLTHQGGLVPDNPLSDYQDGPQKALERIFALKPTVEPGTRFVYSDVGFIVLGELVRRVSGQPLDVFARKNIFEPLGMKDTGFRPGPEKRRRAAATEKRDGHWMKGEVHDPRAWALGGVAGHAGLFSTADDLAVYAQMLLQGGTYRGVRVLGPRTVREMTRPRSVSSGLRALGWDVRSPYSSNRGELFTDSAFGHGGFTGTSLWVDPGLDLFVVFLSNRLHPDGKGSVNHLAGRIGTVAAAAVTVEPLCETAAKVRPRGQAGPGRTVEPQRRSEAASPRQPSATGGSGSQHKRLRPRKAAPSPHRKPAACVTEALGVLPGIDVLRRDQFRLLAGRRVGLITNHTGVSRNGTRTATLLHQAPQVKLVALFSPEHGLKGVEDRPNIPDAKDPELGLPVFSLYGTSRKPTAESLKGIDTLVFDIQDIGTRFYTYVSTMGLAMEAAAENGLRFVVLDRPNPINGVDVEGPVLDPNLTSFTGFHPVPVRHGMTAGELARMFAAERHLKLDLHVVPVEGWNRADYYDATGLLWVNPSPNMRSLTQALLYPGIGLLETTNLSVGRGTDTPFEVLGAPWIDPVTLARELNAQGLPGVRFVPRYFTPTASKFEGERCGGVDVVVTDRRSFRPVRTGLAIARTLRSLYPNQWDAKSFLRLLADRATHQAVLELKPLGEIEATYRDELERFRDRRKRFLLY